MKPIQLFILIIGLYFFGAGTRTLEAQHEHMTGDTLSSMSMPGFYSPTSITRESSGTSWQPESTPMGGLHGMFQDWFTMTQATVDAIYDNQKGKRGDEKTFSESMFMFMANKQYGKGTFGLRSMFSLDPLMGKDGYPLLLQTGETGDGKTPLIDRQHPHDFFMELATTASFSLSDTNSLFVYAGLPGEPALGPPTYMHRFSGESIPSAPITHHWLDSTHITYGVITLGTVIKTIKIETSVFNGHEPDQDRWDIESPRLNSGSLRLSFNPTPNWAMQTSFGYLSSPEILEPDVNVKRTTASIMYNRPFPNANWQTTLAWGQNDNQPGPVLNGFLLESTICFKNTHTIFSRLERVTKNELFPEGDPLHGEPFTVNKATLGYIYDFPVFHHMKWGLGSSLDINIVPKQCKPAYGNNPLGYMIFIRVKLDE